MDKATNFHTVRATCEQNKGSGKEGVRRQGHRGKVIVLDMGQIDDVWRFKKAMKTRTVSEIRYKEKRYGVQGNMRSRTVCVFSHSRVLGIRNTAMLIHIKSIEQKQPLLGPFVSVCLRVCLLF